jgi:uncharacterized membrane protein YqiK
MPTFWQLFSVAVVVLFLIVLAWWAVEGIVKRIKR